VWRRVGICEEGLTNRRGKEWSDSEQMSSCSLRKCRRADSFPTEQFFAFANELSYRGGRITLGLVVDVG
jgi:hypothetical protein